MFKAKIAIPQLKIAAKQLDSTHRKIQPTLSRPSTQNRPNQISYVSRNPFTSIQKQSTSHLFKFSNITTTPKRYLGHDNSKIAQDRIKILELIRQSGDKFAQSLCKTIEKTNIQLFEDESKNKIFGINFENQETIDFDHLRHVINYHLTKQNNYPEFCQLIGDSQLFSIQGTRFAQSYLKNFLTNRPNVIMLYGYTGKHANGATDTNHLLSLLVDNGEIAPHRVLGNIVDYHTPLAIKEWPGVVVSNNVLNYTLIYKRDAQGNASAKFGDDTCTTDNLTNSAVICCEGGIQSLLQIVNVLNKGAIVYGLTGLRDLSDKTNTRAYDIAAGKPYLSAIDFMRHIKEKFNPQENCPEQHLQNIIDEYLKSYSLYNKLAKDADTKQALWEQALAKMVTGKTWEKLEKLIIVSSADLNNEIQFKGETEENNLDNAFPSKKC